MIISLSAQPRSRPAPSRLAMLPAADAARKEPPLIAALYWECVVAPERPDTVREFRELR